MDSFVSTVFVSFVSGLVATALALVLLALTAQVAHAQAHVTVAGVVRDTSGGVVVDAVVEALVGERVIARATTGADGGYSLAGPARTPFALRTHRAGFADEVIALDGDGQQHLARCDAVDWSAVRHAGGHRLSRPGEPDVDDTVVVRCEPARCPGAGLD